MICFEIRDEIFGHVLKKRTINHYHEELDDQPCNHF